MYDSRACGLKGSGGRESIAASDEALFCKLWRRFASGLEGRPMLFKGRLRLHTVPDAF